VVIYKVIKDLATEQQIREAYKRNAKACIAKLQRKARNRKKLKFVLDKTRLIRFKRVVYLSKKVRREFVKEIYKEPLVRHLGIDKTREAVAACYYFLSIFRIVEKIVKECDICNKLRTATHKPYRLLISLLTPKEL
jgi:Integrase zinc binding domain